MSGRMRREEPHATRATHRENFSMSSMLGEPYLSSSRSSRMSSFLPGSTLGGGRAQGVGFGCHVAKLLWPIPWRSKLRGCLPSRVPRRPWSLNALHRSVGLVAGAAHRTPHT